MLHRSSFRDAAQGLDWISLAERMFFNVDLGLGAGTSMMLVFMATITWTWWINRQGVLYWDLDPVPFWDVKCSAEKRNRTVHILKNISIIGALTMLQQMAKYESKDHP